MERHAIEEALNVQIIQASDSLKKTDSKERIVLSLIPKLVDGFCFVANFNEKKKKKSFLFNFKIELTFE